MSARIHLFSAAVALGCILHASQVLACQPCARGGWNGYVFDLDDGQHVFVMKNPSKRTSVCLELWNGVYQTIEEAQAACLERYAFNDPRGAICAWDLRKPITTETQLQEKCVFEFSATEPQDFYPHSGVYTTDSPPELVWKWEGRYLEFSEVKQGISQDGRFLTLAELPDSTDKPALLIYEFGQISRELTLSQFVNDLSQIPNPVDRCGCGPGPTWYRTWGLDHATGQLTVESHADRIVVIDVATGNVLDSKEVTRISVDGLAILRDGTRIELSDVGNCGSAAASMMGMVFVRRPDRLADVRALVGFRVEGTSDSGGRFGTMLIIPLDDVRTVTLTDRNGERRLTLRVALVDGTIQDVTADAPDSMLCGRNTSGEHISIPVKNLQTLIIARPNAGA
jgi:hypothetical protein